MKVWIWGQKFNDCFELFLDLLESLINRYVPLSEVETGVLPWISHPPWQGYLLQLDGVKIWKSFYLDVQLSDVWNGNVHQYHTKGHSLKMSVPVSRSKIRRRFGAYYIFDNIQEASWSVLWEKFYARLWMEFKIFKWLHFLFLSICLFLLGLISAHTLFCVTIFPCWWYALYLDVMLGYCAVFCCDFQHPGAQLVPR